MISKDNLDNIHSFNYPVVKLKRTCITVDYFLELSFISHFPSSLEILGQIRRQKLGTLPAGDGGSLGKIEVTSHLEILTLTRRIWIVCECVWGWVLPERFDGQ